MDEQKIQNLIQQEIKSYMDRNQYSVSKIPNHYHNGSDSPKISTSSIVESMNITGIKGGVFDPAVLDTQKINKEYTSSLSDPGTVSVLPMNIIYGYGVGVHSQFNGGDAPSGTMVFFENTLTNSGLWIKTDNGWYGISPDLTI